jgi:hypothetical protein
MPFVVPVYLDPESRALLESIASSLSILVVKGVPLMSVITDWAAKEQADLTTISTQLQTITAGVQKLDALITSFQNSPGALSASDQAALDAVQAQSKSVVAAVQAIDTSAPGSAPPASS